MEMKFVGKMSTFGGPDDTGVTPSEGLALVNSAADFESVREFFLAKQPKGTTGFARRLNPEKFYLACRWHFSETPKRFLLQSFVTVTNPKNGQTAEAKPIDFGPHQKTGRIADLSPGLAAFLGLQTDDTVEVTVRLPQNFADTTALETVNDTDTLTATTDLDPAESVAAGNDPTVRQIRFHFVPAHAFKHGRTLDIQSIVVHSTDGQEAGDIETLTGNSVSVHWYITRDGRFFHFVDNADTAFHAGVVSNPKFSNSASLGIEQEHIDHHQDWPEAQIQSAANLCAFLFQKHNLSKSVIKRHADVAAPPGRKEDPVAYPMQDLFTKIDAAMTFQWVAVNINGD